MGRDPFRILAFVFLISLAFIMPADARIEYYSWTNPSRRNYYDDYYGATVTAYDRGTTAILIVNVYNNRFWPHAYFTVKVKMDWAAFNVTSTEEDYKIKYGESHTFEVRISVPLTASERYRHVYTIYSMYREALGEELKNDDTWTSSDLVVYSPEQSEANSLAMELNAYPSYIYTPLLSSSKARELITEASLHETLGDQSYSRGDFEGARDHYELALNYTVQAYASETEYLSNLERAIVTIVNAGQIYLTVQGLGYLLTSLGFLLIGIGAIVYLVRKSRPQAS